MILLHTGEARERDEKKDARGVKKGCGRAIKRMNASIHLSTLAPSWRVRRQYNNHRIGQRHIHTAPRIDIQYTTWGYYLGWQF